jgi:hypothetical protein
MGSTLGIFDGIRVVFVKNWNDYMGCAKCLPRWDGDDTGDPVRLPTLLSADLGDRQQGH